MRRSQAAWGVMEVLIATIILGASMAVVFYALRNIEETKCVAELKSHTIALQNAVLDVALGSPPTQRRVVYTMPVCGDRSVEALRLVYYSKRENCRLCPGQYAGCWIIEPTVYDYKLKRFYPLVDAATCVNMPADIRIEPVTTSPCLSNQITQSPCPSPLPPGVSCNQRLHGVPQSVYNPSAPNTLCTQSQTTACSNSLWRTFGRKQGDPRTFVFELSKEVLPGLTGLIKVCPKVERR